MTNDEIIKIVKNEVFKIYNNDTTGHDYYHIKRVIDVAKYINEEENANSFIIVMISLLHDIYDHKFYSGDIKEALTDFLKEIEVHKYISLEEKNNIIDSCVNLSFSSNIEKKNILSKEGMIVQDADRLDALGVMGIIRTFIYTGYKNNPIYLPSDNNDLSNYYVNGSNSAISHFYDKLLKLKDLMNTNRGKQLAIKRHQILIDFLEEFYIEWDSKDIVMKKIK